MHTVTTIATTLGQPGWHHDGPGWHGPPWPLLFVLPLVVAGIVALVVWSRRSGRHAATAVLADRYARGEIDHDDYRERRRGLRGRP